MPEPASRACAVASERRCGKAAFYKQLTDAQMTSSTDDERTNELKARANKAVAASDFNGAVQTLTEAITLRPGLKELWSNRAFAWSALGRHDEALKDARQCMTIAPAFSKGYLRAGRALIALGHHDDAAELLEDAAEKIPQDYALGEALEDALAAAAAAARAPLQTPTPPPPAVTQPSAAPAASDKAGGLTSSYYYAAVPASERKLPVTAPPRIITGGGGGGGSGDGGGNGGGGGGLSPDVPVKAVANGAIREDLERKGADSYYYAHDRKTDFTVPTVPKKLNPDGSMTPWDGR